MKLLSRAGVERWHPPHDRALKRICGFSMWKKLPGEATFSRAFAEFAADGLAALAHEALVKEALDPVLVGHISRDGTAIEGREKPARKISVAEAPLPKKRGRPKPIVVLLDSGSSPK